MKVAIIVELPDDLDINKLTADFQIYKQYNKYGDTYVVEDGVDVNVVKLEDDRG